MTQDSSTDQTQQRSEQQREAASHEMERLDRGRRNKLRQRVVIGAAVVAVAVGGVVLTESLNSTDQHQVATSSDATAVATQPFTPLNHQALATTASPWPAPGDSRPFILAAGLPVLSREQPIVHYEAHLDVTIYGSVVRVPAGIGFVTDNGHQVGVSVLHAHNASGVIHVESPTDLHFTLGQFVTEWGVRLGPGQLGGLVNGQRNTLRTYVNGRVFTGDPATIVLASHQEIVLWFGPVMTTPHVTDSYRFPSDD